MARRAFVTGGTGFVGINLIERLKAEGWDVTDDRRRPLRMFDHFAPQLWLALRGVAGELPFQAEADPDEAVYSSLAADAAKFRRDRR